jgi:methyltransferase-like protein
MDTKRPLQKDGILSRKLDDEWLLYNTGEESIHVINSMAEFVWRMCDGTHDLDDIENRVRDAYLVSDETNLRQDVEEIIQNFEDLGILVYKKVGVMDNQARHPAR